MGYFVNGFVVTPIVNGSLHKQIIKKDFQRNRYYNQFVARSRKVLVSLYGAVDDWHREVFGKSYDLNVVPSEIVEKLFEGNVSTMCKYVDDHMENIVDRELWVLCETDQGKERSCEGKTKCPHWKEK